MEENSIRITPFSGENKKWFMRSGKLLERERRLGYYIILRVTMKTLVENAGVLKQLNKTTYHDLILAKDDTVCLQTFSIIGN